MSVHTLTLNGAPVAVPAGSSLLEACSNSRLSNI